METDQATAEAARPLVDSAQENNPRHVRASGEEVARPLVQGGAARHGGGGVSGVATERLGPKTGYYDHIDVGYREKALNGAVHFAQHGGIPSPTPEAIVSCAKAFYAFLSGEDASTTTTAAASSLSNSPAAPLILSGDDTQPVVPAGGAL